MKFKKKAFNHLEVNTVSTQSQLKWNNHHHNINMEMQLFYTVMHAWILLIEIKIQIASSRNDLI